MYSRNNVEKGWGQNKTTKITHMNDSKNESKESERERANECGREIQLYFLQSYLKTNYSVSSDISWLSVQGG